MNSRNLVAGLAVLMSGACVSTGSFRAKENELVQTQRRLAEREKAAADDHARLTRELERAKTEAQALGRKFASVSYDRDILRDGRDGDLVLLGQLKKRLDALGQNVQTLTQEKGALAASTAEAMGRLQELHRLKAAADARAETYRGLVDKLRDMISAGSLEVVIRQGRMLIVLPNDILFDSGRTQIRSQARDALGAVAHALKGVVGRRFSVVGHTDDVPIHTARFRSNWDLSTARAVEVSLFLIAAGVDPRRLGAAGHGEFDPVASNDSEANRHRNRRVEIEIEPNITELPLAYN